MLDITQISIRPNFTETGGWRVWMHLVWLCDINRHLCSPTYCRCTVPLSPSSCLNDKFAGYSKQTL